MTQPNWTCRTLSLSTLYSVLQVLEFSLKNVLKYWNKISSTFMWVEFCCVEYDITCHNSIYHGVNTLPMPPLYIWKWNNFDKHSLWLLWVSMNPYPKWYNHFWLMRTFLNLSKKITGILSTTPNHDSMLNSVTRAVPQRWCHIILLCADNFGCDFICNNDLTMKWKHRWTNYLAVYMLQIPFCRLTAHW